MDIDFYQLSQKYFQGTISDDEEKLLAGFMRGSEQNRAKFRQWEEENGGQDEEQMILELFRKRGFDPENASPAERRREYGFLMRKGFSSERVRSAVFGHFTEETF